MTRESSTSPLISTRNLKVYFPVARSPFPGRNSRKLKAVDGVDLEIMPGETLGLVGESGCGKTTTGRAILQLVKPTSGEVWYRDHELTRLKEKQLRPLRKKLQMVFQDPYSSLNPRMTVGDILAEPIKVHGLCSSKSEIKDQVASLLDVVGLSPIFASRYPHEFSGGQRQRIGIARALSLKPEFIVGDEPVSALDVSVQAQVLNLLMDLQDRFSLTYLFVAHNLAVVRHISTRVAVMYLGKIVENSPSDALYEQPAHPYTRALLSAVLSQDPAKSQASITPVGEMPSPISPPTGCAFHPRCPFATERCREETPELRPIASAHFVACHHAEELA